MFCFVAIAVVLVAISPSAVVNLVSKSAISLVLVEIAVFIAVVNAVVCSVSSPLNFNVSTAVVSTINVVVVPRSYEIDGMPLPPLNESN